MRIFCSCVVIFPNPAGARKNTSNEQNVRSYFMLNHRIRGLLFRYKKNCYLAIGFYFFGRNILIPYVRMTLTMGKMFARIILASIFYLICVLRFVQFSHSCSFCIRRYSPCCKPVKPGHYSELRPRILRVLLTYMVKWRNSGIITWNTFRQIKIVDVFTIVAILLL